MCRAGSYLYRSCSNCSITESISFLLTGAKHPWAWRDIVWHGTQCGRWKLWTSISSISNWAANLPWRTQSLIKWIPWLKVKINMMVSWVFPLTSWYRRSGNQCFTASAMRRLSLVNYLPLNPQEVKITLPGGVNHLGRLCQLMKGQFSLEEKNQNIR